MFFKKKNKFKPLYKQFLELKENIQNRKKFAKFKKKKWKFFIQNYAWKLKKYKKFKPRDQARYLVSQYPSRGLSYKAKTKNNQQTLKKFKLLFGGLPKRFVKKRIKIILKKKHKRTSLLFLEFFERRLDTILYRSKFGSSIRNARQLILHGKIFVNKKPIKTKSYILSFGDIITINPRDFKLIKTNVRQSVI